MLKIFLFTSLPFYLFTSLPVFGGTQVLFSPESKIRDHILKSINDCNSSLEIAVYDFSSGDIAEALVDAKNRGVKIRIVMDKKQAEKEGSLYGFLKDDDFDVVLLKGKVGGSMHNSFVIFDNKFVLTGSYNWTEYAEKFNYENAILTDEKAMVEMYQNEFKRLYTDMGTTVGAGLKPAPTVTESNTGQTLFAKEAVPQGQKKPTVEKKIESASGGPLSLPSPSEVGEANMPKKEFIDISFEELDKIFGSESTLSRSEKNERWEQYKGKYVRWTGVVGYKGIGRTDWNRMGIKHTDKVDVELWFDYKMMTKVLSIRERQIITYTGLLYSRRGYSAPYRLKDGWIEE